MNLAEAFISLKPKLDSTEFRVAGERASAEVARSFERPMVNLARNVAKMFQDLIGDSGKKGGHTMAAKLLDEISGSVPKGMAGYLTVGAIAAAPAIGAAVNAGVLLGIGGGGIAAGIALAARDAAVKAAGAQVGRHMLDGLTEAAVSFRQPVIASLSILQGGFDRLQPHITAIFAGLSVYLEPLARGVVAAFDRIGPSLQRAAAASGPLLGVLAAGLPQLGSAVASFLDSISRGAPGAALFLRDLITSTSAAIVVAGKLIEYLSKLYELSSKIPGLGGAFQILGNVMGQSGDKGKTAFFNLKGGADAATTSIYGSATAVADLQAKLTGLLSASLGVDQAQLAIARALADVTKTALGSAHTLDLNTDAGRANMGAILAAVGADEQLRDAQIRGGASAEYANSVFRDQVGQLGAVLAKAGFTSQQIQGLIGKYLAIPASVATNVIVNGVDSATERVLSLVRAVNSLHDRVITTTLIQNTITGETRESVHPGLRIQKYGGILAAAYGGIVKAAQGLIASAPTFLFGEAGRELFLPLTDVISRSRAFSLLAEGARAWDYGLVDMRALSRRVVPPVSVGAPAGGWMAGGGETRLDAFTISRLGQEIGGQLSRRPIEITGPNYLDVGVAGVTR